MGIYDLSQHLGHTSVKTTEIYLNHLTHSEKARVKTTNINRPILIQNKAGGNEPSQNLCASPC